MSFSKTSGKVLLYQVHIEMQVKSETLGFKNIVSNLFANIKTWKLLQIENFSVILFLSAVP